MTSSGIGQGRSILGVGFWAQQAYYIQNYILAPLPIGVQFIVDDLPPAWSIPYRADQFWSFNYVGSPWIISPAPDTTKVFRGHQKSLPDQPPPPNAFQSWTWRYNLNLIGQDRLPASSHPGENQIDDLPPAYWAFRPMVDQYNWAWRYNPNLVGKDKFPAGQQLFELSPRDYPRLANYTWLQAITALTLPAPVVPDTTHILRPIWRSLPDQPPQPLTPSWALNLLTTTLAPKAGPWQQVFNQYDWPNPQQPPRLEQTWTWQYKLQLIGQDRLPAGDQRFELTAAQVPPDQIQLRAWSWSYNLNLIGQDKLPVGAEIWDRPQLAIPPALTWIQTVSYEEIAKPFAQYDWPNATPPYRIEQTWAWRYNLNLIGQDHLPAGQQTTELPPRDFARLFQTWIQNVNLALVVTPPALTPPLLFSTKDYPNPRGAEPDWRRGWEWSYNKNLIGQDQLPIGVELSELPPRDFPRLLQTWVQQTNLALLTVLQIPFKQLDWPNPTPPPRLDQTWTSSYNKNLIGQDQLPFRQQDWPLTPAAQRAGELSTWVDRVKLQLLLSKPFGPFDWPLPTPVARDPTLTSFAGRYLLELIGQDRLPFRQQDWPLSSAHALAQIPLQIMVAGKSPFLVPFQLLPPGVMITDRPQLRPNVPADLYTITHAQQIPQPAPVVTPAVYNKPMLAGPGYLDVIPGEKSS